MKHLTKVRMIERTFITSVPKILAKAIGLGTGDLLMWTKTGKGKLTVQRLDDWASKAQTNNGGSGK